MEAHTKSVTIEKHGVFHESTRKQVIGTLIAAMGPFICGTIVGFSGISLTQMTEPNTFEILCLEGNVSIPCKSNKALIIISSEEPYNAQLWPTPIKLTMYEANMFASSLNIGKVVGALSSSFVIVKLGPRKAMMAGLPFILLSWFLLFCGSSPLIIILSRFFIGIPAILMAMSSISFISEISQEHIRGSLVATVDLSRTLGILFITLLGSTKLDWRYSALVCGLFTVIPTFICLIFLPDSYRWLILRGKHDDAMKSLKFYVKASDEVLNQEIEIINHEQRTKLTFKSQFKSLKERPVLKRVFILSLLSFISPFKGAQVTVEYSTMIFKASRMPINEYTGTIILGIVRVLSVLIFMSTVDRIGRKVTFSIAFILSFAFVFALGIFFYLSNQKYNLEGVKFLPPILFVFFVFTITSAEPTATVYNAELLPNSVRALGLSITTTLCFVSLFVNSYAFPFMIESSLGFFGTFWFSSFICLVLLLFMFVLPETKGKTLESIGNDNK